MKKILIETWKSDHNEEEKHFFIGNTYLFGINAKLIGKKARKKIEEIIKAEILSDNK